jgi:tetratricopeptide (TPR) repeat protein
MCGRQEQADRFGQLLLNTPPEPEARVTYLEALGNVAFSSAWRGVYRESSACLARLLKLGAKASPGASPERAWSVGAQAAFSLYFEGRLWQSCLGLEQAYQGFLEVGLERSAMGAQIQRAQALEALGDRASAEFLFRESLALARRLAQEIPNLQAGLELALFLASSSDPAQREEALALTNGWEIDHLYYFAGLLYTIRAKVAAATGDLSEAERQARKACEKLDTSARYHFTARVLLSQVLLAQGRTSEARELAAPGVRELEALGGTGLPAVSVYLVLAEACLADNDSQTAEVALRKALQCVRSRAKDIPDEAARQRFLLQVPENARTLELARQRWGTAEA